MRQIYRRPSLPKCDFNEFAKQLYWNHTSAWVLSCRFAAYFQNNFSEEHLWRAASVMFQITELFSYCCYTFEGIEKVVHEQTTKFLNDNNIFCKYRSDFRNNHSTDLFLSFLSDKILKGFDKGLHTGMVLIDLLKTFDTITHKIPLINIFQ